MSDKKARDVMSTDCTCVGENETLLDAARMLAEKDVGALPICGEDDRLKGMLTDRDIVVKALAKGKDPGTTRAGEQSPTADDGVGHGSSFVAYPSATHAADPGHATGL